jgi:predicted negative regulator of RcsB-dependent stress response
LNQRTQEAEAMLKAMKPGQLKPQEINDYHLAWFEVYLQKKQYDLARNTVDRIETKDFFPAQRSWYENALKSLPAK